MSALLNAGKASPEDRPRLRVILPLILVCLGAVFFAVQDRLEPRAGGKQNEGPSLSFAERDRAGARSDELGRPFQATPARLRAAPGETPQEFAVTEPASDTVATPGKVPPDEAAAVRSEFAAGGVAVTGASAIEGRISLNGTPPPEVEIALDASCGASHTSALTTRFYRVDAEGGLADVFVSIRDGLENVRFAPPSEPVWLDQAGCEFVPYVLGLQTSQTLLVRNSDAVLHNVHPTPTAPGNQESNRAQLPGGPDLALRFDRPEIFLRIKCDIHPWMFAYVGVVDHPFFAVSGLNGSYSIPHLPPGRYSLEAYHRKAGRASREVIVRSGERVRVDFTLDVAPN